MLRPYVLAAIVLLMALGPVRSDDRWHSRLYAADGDGGWTRSPVSFAGRDWRMSDFSYAGYRQGEAPLATDVPRRWFPVESGKDFAEALQAAVEAAGKAGGGVVQIPAGRFEIRKPVRVPYDNVSIEGAGSDATVLEVPPDYRQPGEFHGGLFVFGRVPASGPPWLTAAGPRGKLLARAEAGASTIAVSHANELAIGDWIVLWQPFGRVFARLHSTKPNAWPAADDSPRFAFAVLRRVTAISGARVRLDAPLPRTLDPDTADVGWHPVPEEGVRAPTRNVGIAGLRIEFAPSRRAGGARPVGAGVYFGAVVDGWAFDVRLHDIPRFGLFAHASARLTWLDTAVIGAQYDGSGGWGYAYHLHASQDVVVRSVYAADTTTGVTLQGASTAGVVVTDGRFEATRGSSDTHFTYSHSILWDNLRLRHGAGLKMIYRGAKSDGAHETVGDAVVWNLHGDGCLGGWSAGALHMNPAADAQALVIGGTGDHAVFDGTTHNPGGESFTLGRRMSAKEGFQVGSRKPRESPGGAEANVLYENLGRPGLHPVSLYEAQLRMRTGHGPWGFRDGRGAAARTRGLPRHPGPGTLVFDSDRLGWIPRLDGFACRDCDADAPVPGGQALRIRPSPRRWAIAGQLRGCRIGRDQAGMLRLRVKADREGAALRLRLHERLLPKQDPRDHADIVVTAGKAGAWTTVTIPLADLPEYINELQIRSLGEASDATFYLDDIVLLP